ncbi:MAG: hypothetical protein M1837_004746 [Sclerophora amabilis]|nr:MAG: hypothetical protein M1837_004746 [Sclerophora amabilis]
MVLLSFAALLAFLAAADSAIVHAPTQSEFGRDKTQHLSRRQNPGEIELQPVRSDTSTWPAIPPPAWFAWLSLPLPSHDLHELNEPSTTWLANEAAKFVMNFHFSRPSFSATIYFPEKIYTPSPRLETFSIRIDWINTRHGFGDYHNFPTPNRLVVDGQKFRAEQERSFGTAQERVSPFLPYEDVELPRKSLGWWISNALNKGYSSGTVMSEVGDLEIIFHVMSSSKVIRLLAPAARRDEEETGTSQSSHPQQDQSDWIEGQTWDMVSNDETIGRCTITRQVPSSSTQTSLVNKERPIDPGVSSSEAAPPEKIQWPPSDQLGSNATPQRVGGRFICLDIERSKLTLGQVKTMQDEYRRRLREPDAERHPATAPQN